MALKGNDRDNHFNGTIFDDEIYAFGGNDDIHGSPLVSGACCSSAGVSTAPIGPL